MSEHGQFYHYELYGRKESNAKKKENCSLYSILGEAFREAKYSSHIDKKDTENNPPKIIYGMQFEKDLPNEEKLKKQKEKLMVLAEKYAINKNLKMKDGCIMAGVVSYPPETSKEEMYKIQKELVIPFLLKKFGINLRCVISHSDEYYWIEGKKTDIPHFQDHFYIIPDVEDEIRLTQLHAGIVAKRKAIAGKADEDGKKHSDKKYREAMSLVQDEFFEQVGKPAGWQRTTVNGVRYKHREVNNWKKNKKEEEQQKEDVKLLCNNITTEANNSAETIKSEAQKEAEDILKEAREVKKQAWKSAKDIIKTANDQAAKMFNDIKNLLQNVITKFIPKEKRKEVDNYVKNEVENATGQSLNIKTIKTDHGKFKI